MPVKKINLMIFLCQVFVFGSSSIEITVSGVDQVLSTGQNLHLLKYSNWTVKTIHFTDLKNEKQISVISPWKKLVVPDYKFSPRQVLKVNLKIYWCLKMAVNVFGN